MKNLLVGATLIITVAAVNKRIAELNYRVESVENEVSVLRGEITQINAGDVDISLEKIAKKFGGEYKNRALKFSPKN